MHKIPYVTTFAQSCSTLQLFPGSLRPSTRSRISGGVVSERKIAGHGKATFGSTAFFLRQDAAQSLECCRYSLSEKGTSPADGSEPGRSRATPPCSAHSPPTHPAHDPLRHRSPVRRVDAPESQ